MATTEPLTKVCPTCGAKYPAESRFCELDGTPLRDLSDSGELVGSVIGERYHILKRIGAGGMGEVYLAEHVKIGRKSALKVMRPELVAHTESMRRFNREATNASSISHQNVATVYDFGETPDGLAYIAMEYVEGTTLRGVIEREGALPPARVSAIVSQIAHGLAAAHAKQIVHRDLKPDNVMITHDWSRREVVKVVDFGIARIAESETQRVTMTGVAIGTQLYMSPEQLAGDRVDWRSDIYSLGLMTFELLTGKLPFAERSIPEAIARRLRGEQVSLHGAAPGEWPPELQAILDRALQLDRANRYQSAVEFASDLKRVVDLYADATTVATAPDAIPRTATPASPPVVSRPAFTVGVLNPLRQLREGPHVGGPRMVGCGVIVAGIVGIAVLSRSGELSRSHSKFQMVTKAPIVSKGVDTVSRPAPRATSVDSARPVPPLSTPPPSRLPTRAPPTRTIVFQTTPPGAHIRIMGSNRNQVFEGTSPTSFTVPADLFSWSVELSGFLVQTSVVPKIDVRTKLVDTVNVVLAPREPRPST